MPPIINQDKCTACGICVDICPTDVFFGSRKGEIPFVAYPNECFHDNACVADCPVEGAIKLRIPLTMMLIYK
jgi:NAD-dependent dihydropyrimidine dehydrogenase PreA subunit